MHMNCENENEKRHYFRLKLMKKTVAKLNCLLWFCLWFKICFKFPRDVLIQTHCNPCY